MPVVSVDVPHPLLTGLPAPDAPSLPLSPLLEPRHWLPLLSPAGSSATRQGLFLLPWPEPALSAYRMHLSAWDCPQTTAAARLHATRVTARSLPNAHSL